MKKIFLFFLTMLFGVSYAQVSLDEARLLVGNDQVTVLDIRESIEHAIGVVKGMKLIPMSSLESRLHELPKNPNSRVLLKCNTQNRSSAVANELRARGYTNVEYVLGGMS